MHIGLVYPLLQYSVMTWRNTTARCLNKIQTQQNCLVKLRGKAPLIKTILSSLYEQLPLLKLNNIYELEVLKFASKLKNENPAQMF